MGKRQLTAEQWRVISYLYHPDQLSRRTPPNLSTVISKQAVAREDVIELAERGLVQTKFGRDECAIGQLKRLPATKIRLRLTRAGIYHASHDPQHLVLCALRTTIADWWPLDKLMHRLPSRPISFGDLREIAERGLIAIFLVDVDREVAIADVRSCPELAYARATERGRTFVGYL